MAGFQASPEARDHSKGGVIKLAGWQEEFVIDGYLDKVSVWLCGCTRESDTNNVGMTLIGWRCTEEEMSTLCVECAGYFDRAIRPPKVFLHGPHSTERLRG